MHRLGPEQDTQTPPPLPQSCFEVPATQSLLLQQPAQLVESQTQVPPEQRCPAAQAARFPHRQSPVALQVSVVCGQVTQATPARPQAVTDGV